MRKMEQPVCYICFEPSTEENPFVTDPRPCLCKGSIEIHKQCLEQVLKPTRHCSVCKAKYHKQYLPHRDGKELVIEAVDSGVYAEYTINDDGQKHGTYHLIKNGNLLVTQSYINGKMEGLFVAYFPNGAIQIVCRCKNNKIEGDYTEWYSDGTLKEESFYVNGKKHGESIEWLRSGYTRVSNFKRYEDGECVEGDVELE
jgi:RING-variant domain/MORN repeat variant